MNNILAISAAVILGIIVLLLPISIIIFIIKSFKKKRYIAAGIASGITFLTSAGIVVYMINGGVFVETGVSGSTFQYINHGTGSMGSHAIYYVDSPSILVEEKSIRYSDILGYGKKFGHSFRAVESGECSIVVQEIDCADIAYVDVYHINVDEKLNCTYTQKRIVPPKNINVTDRLVSVRYKGKELAEIGAVTFYNNMIMLYGENTACEKPSENYPVMEIEYCCGWKEPPATRVFEYHIKDESTFYYLFDNVWYEYTKDPDCKNGIIDIFNMTYDTAEIYN